MKTFLQYLKEASTNLDPKLKPLVGKLSDRVLQAIDAGFKKVIEDNDGTSIKSVTFNDADHKAVIVYQYTPKAIKSEYEEDVDLDKDEHQGFINWLSNKEIKLNKVVEGNLYIKFNGDNVIELKRAPALSSDVKEFPPKTLERLSTVIWVGPKLGFEELVDQYEKDNE